MQVNELKKSVQPGEMLENINKKHFSTDFSKPSLAGMVCPRLIFGFEFRKLSASRLMYSITFACTENIFVAIFKRYFYYSIYLKQRFQHVERKFTGFGFKVST